MLAQAVEYKLRTSQLRILASVRGGVTSISDIADVMDKSEKAMRGSLNGLIKRGCICPVTDDHYALTGRGLQELENAG